MLIHICCSVDNLYFLKKAKEAFVGEKIIGFFITPISTLIANTCCV